MPTSRKALVSLVHLFNNKSLLLLYLIVLDKLFCAESIYYIQ